MTKFIHSADWQLGMTRHFLADEAQARFDGARLDVVRQIGGLAVANDCGFVVVAGDVFESNHVDRQVVVRALDAMATTPDVTFYLLPGNHDPLDASSVFRSAAFTTHQPANVVVLETSEPLPIAPSVELVGAPWFSKRPLSDLVADACVDFTNNDVVRIVVGHGGVDTLSPDPTNPALISVSDLDATIAAGAVHYVALGDRHSTTTVGASGRIRYSGAPEPTDFREDDPGNVLIVDVGVDHCDVERVEVATWKFIAQHFDVNNSADLDAIDDWATAIAHRDRCIVKLSLVGQLSLGEKARLDHLLDHYGELFASVNVWERHTDLVVLPTDDDIEQLQLTGFAGAALDELRNRSVVDHHATSGNDRDVANDALGLLFRLGSDRS
jgi:DNA repair exonuclease SbcCD nuclease subunit